MFTEQTSVETVTSGQTHNNNPSKKPRQISTYIVSEMPPTPGKAAIPFCQVEGTTYQQAANAFAKQTFGSNSYANRVKGIAYFSDCSGYFQAYSFEVGEYASPIGEPFHLRKIYSSSISIAAKAASK